MVFQKKEKDLLWHYASKNCTAVDDGMINSPQQQQQHPQLQRLPQQQSLTNQTSALSRMPFGNCYCSCGCSETSNSSTGTTIPQHVQTPPPPYSCSVPFGKKSSDCSEDCTFQAPYSMSSLGTVEGKNFVSQQHHPQQQRRRVHPEAESIKSGCNYGNYNDDSTAEDISNDHSMSSAFPAKQKYARRSSPPLKVPASIVSTGWTANVFRCCGFSSGSTTTINNNHNNASKPIKRPISPQESQAVPQLKDTFKAFMKLLKVDQRNILLESVRSRVDPASLTNTKNSLALQTQCLLIPRAKISKEEPQLLACRLFFWQDLKNAEQLKRLPICSNDMAYICCNPLHWCRILETEIAPPPYQRKAMERLKSEDYSQATSCNTSLNGGSTCTASIGSSSCNTTTTSANLSISSNCSSNSCSTISNTSKCNPCVQIPESLTTDGDEQRRTSSIWCKVAYWEHTNRVGALYSAENSSINIYADGPCGGGSGDGMSLKDLIQTPSSQDVQRTRNKIGLGVTLSQEADDGVWLFNRSNVPIFVHSPTLSESLFGVSRVMPGECLKAFDRDRALNLPYSSLTSTGAHAGPVDTFSMRISFAKGWGWSYKRQDIINCPCWLEVLFNKR